MAQIGAGKAAGVIGQKGADLYPLRPEIQQVEGIGLGAPAIGQAGACLHEDQPRRGGERPGMADMNMAGKHDLRPRLGQALQGLGRAGHQPLGFFG